MLNSEYTSWDDSNGEIIVAVNICTGGNSKSKILKHVLLWGCPHPVRYRLRPKPVYNQSNNYSHRVQQWHYTHNNNWFNKSNNLCQSQECKSYLVVFGMSTLAYL